MQFLHHVSGRALLDQIRRPDGVVEVFERRAFLHAGHIGQRRQPFAVQRADDLQPAFPAQVFVVGLVRHDGEVDLAASHVRDQRRAAAIRDVRQRDAGASSQRRRDQVNHRARAARAIGQRHVALAGHGDQLVDIGRAQIGARHHHVGRGGHGRHKLKVFGLVRYGLVRQPRQNQLVGRTLKEQIAVGLGVQHAVGAQRAIGAAQVFNHHLRAQRL